MMVETVNGDSTTNIKASIRFYKSYLKGKNIYNEFYKEWSHDVARRKIAKATEELKRRNQLQVAR